MLATIALIPALLAAQAAARVCVNATIPVNITARQGVYDVPALQGNLDATMFSMNMTKLGANFTDEALTGFRTVRGVYNISAKYCRPDGDNSTNPTLQFLTHGIGFDKSYWDIPFNGYNYSYIDAALDAGFHTVSIDRLGIGNSSHADPLNVVQAPAEVSAIYEVTSMLRAGTCPGVDRRFGKVVHVGHSFGSVQTYLLSAMHPEATDGIVLTGFSFNSSFMGTTMAAWNLHLARLNQPIRFGSTNVPLYYAARGLLEYYGNGTTDIVQLANQLLSSYGFQYSSSDLWNVVATTEVGNLINGINFTLPFFPQNLPSGYLTWADLTANQFTFLYPPSVDPAIGPYTEQNKQPVTIGELLSLSGGAPNSSSFGGPVQIVTGQQDVIFCGGDCLETGGVGPSIPAQGRVAFPNASAFEAYIQPNTGHAINVHYNSSGAYGVINNFLKVNGLGSS